MAEHAKSDDPSGRLNYHTEEIRHLFNEIDEDGVPQEEGSISGRA